VADTVPNRKVQDEGPCETLVKTASFGADPAPLSSAPDTYFYDTCAPIVSTVDATVSTLETTRKPFQV
jgi:hypothetical protein